MKKIKLVFAISITIALVFISIVINEVNSYLYAFIGISATWSWFNHESNISELKEMYEIEVEYSLKQRDKIDALKLEVDEKYQELSLLRQKYSRTNQPRSGGKFVKKVQERGSAEDVFNENGGARVTNLDGYTGILCGYCTGVEYGQWDEFIIGLNNEKGFIRIDEFDIINKKYKSYKYCSYQDILKAKTSNP